MHNLPQKMLVHVSSHYAADLFTDRQHFSSSYYYYCPWLLWQAFSSFPLSSKPRGADEQKRLLGEVAHAQKESKRILLRGRRGGGERKKERGTFWCSCALLFLSLARLHTPPETHLIAGQGGQVGYLIHAFLAIFMSCL